MKSKQAWEIKELQEKIKDLVKAAKPIKDMIRKDLKMGMKKHKSDSISPYKKINLRRSHDMEDLQTSRAKAPSKLRLHL